MSIAYKLTMFAVAIILTSLVVGLCFAAISLEPPEVTFGVAVSAIVVSIPILAALGLILGMPVAFVLQRLKARGYLIWGVAGLLAGALVVSVFRIVMSGGAAFDAPADTLIAFLGLGAVPGIAAGLFWWRAVARFEQHHGAQI